MARANPIINRKRVLEVFKEQGVTLTADAKEFLEQHMESFFEELALCFDEDSKVTGDEMTEAYELMVPEPPDDDEEAEEAETVSDGDVTVGMDKRELSQFKTFKNLRPDVIKHALALNELIHDEAKIIAQHL